MRSVLVIGVIMAAACGEDEAEKACEDFADAFEDLGTRCFPDDPTAAPGLRDAALDAVDGDCGNVIEVRDIDEFYDECLPWIDDVACSIVEDPGFELDSSCRGQLQI